MSPFINSLKGRCFLARICNKAVDSSTPAGDIVLPLPESMTEVDARVYVLIHRPPTNDLESMQG